MLVFTLSILLFSCDDGKLDVVSFDFKDTNPKVCNVGVANSFFLFNIKDKRALILKIPESTFNTSLSNVSNVLNISSTNELFYREYVDVVGVNNICGSPTSANLNLAKEWPATGGTIKITTTLSKTDPQADGSTSYTNYNSVITLTNVVFNTGNGEQRNDVINLGTYSKPNPNVFTPFTGPVNKCNDNSFNVIFSNRAMILKVDSSIFDTSVLDTPKTKVINGTTNSVTFTSYNTSIAPLTSNALCASPTSASSSVIESWIANNGDSTTGQIQVITSTKPGTNPVKYKHSIVLKGVTVTNKDFPSYNFKFPTTLVFGDYEP